MNKNFKLISDNIHYVLLLVNILLRPKEPKDEQLYNAVQLEYNINVTLIP